MDCECSSDMLYGLLGTGLVAVLNLIGRQYTIEY